MQTRSLLDSGPMMRRHSLLGYVVLGLGMCMWAGCGNNQPTTAKVTGHVYLDGKPLATGNVMTLPATGRGARGVIQSDGRFELGTMAATDGARLGVHKVAVVAYEGGGRGPEGGDGKLLVPQRYTNPETSGLTIEVTSGSNTPEVKLTTP